jgi:RNA recognition motif-containing protein
MANPKRTVYVGGLAEEVDEKTLHAAFIPFGKKTKSYFAFFIELGMRQLQLHELSCICCMPSVPLARGNGQASVLLRTFYEGTYASVKSLLNRDYVHHVGLSETSKIPKG